MTRVTLTEPELCPRCKRPVAAGEQMAVYGFGPLAQKLRRCLPCDGEVNTEIKRLDAKREASWKDIPDDATTDEVARINRARLEGFGERVTKYRFVAFITIAASFDAFNHRWPSFLIVAATLSAAAWHLANYYEREASR